jgi:hypothetical protein
MNCLPAPPRCVSVTANRMAQKMQGPSLVNGKLRLGKLSGSDDRFWGRTQRVCSLFRLPRHWDISWAGKANITTIITAQWLGLDAVMISNSFATHASAETAMAF